MRDLFLKKLWDGKRKFYLLLLGLVCISGFVAYRYVTDAERIRQYLEARARETWQIPITIREASFGPGWSFHLKDIVLPLEVEGLAPIHVDTASLVFHPGRFIVNRPAFVSLTVSGSRIELDMDRLPEMLKKRKETQATPHGLRLPFATFQRIFPSVEIQNLSVQAVGETFFQDSESRGIESISFSLTPTSRHVCAVRAKVDDPLWGKWEARAYLDIARMGGRGAVQCRRLQVTKDMREALPPPARVVWDKFKLEGEIGCTVGVGLDLQNRQTPLDYHLVLDLYDAAATYYEFPLRAYHVNGRIVMDRRELHIQRLEGRRGNTRIHFLEEEENRIVLLPGKFKVKLSMAIADLPIDEAFRQAIGEEARQIVNEYNIGDDPNPVDVVLRIDFNPRRKRRFKNDLAFKFKGMDITWSGFPYPLKDVHGILRLQLPEQVILNNLAGKHGTGTMVVDGTISYVEKGMHTEIRVTGNRLPFDEDLRRVLPSAVQKGWENIALSGFFDPDLVVTHDGWTGKTPDITGRLYLSEAALSAGMKLTKMQGNVDFKLQSAGELATDAFDGQLALEYLEVDGMAIQDLESPLVMTGERVSLPKFQGKMYEGALKGYLYKDMVEGGRYEGSIHLVGANLDAFGRHYFTDRFKEMKGSMDLAFDYEGIVDDEHSMTGKGNAHIQDGKLWELPVLLGLLSILKLSPTDKPVFEGANFVFNVAERKIHFKTISFEGNAWSLYGEGIVGFDKECDLVFSISSIPGLTFLLDQLIQVGIQGTIDEPEIGIRPLNILGLPFRWMSIFFGQMQEKNGEDKTSGQRNGHTRRRRPLQP